ncbi:MAG TPA: lysylphosphatidylglycerol synthase transmembrane domain-containing protein [Thermomicrobiales bacterium]|nr:lysylphosphatidylglycerol synthase transmembrane domain-containing protein [Thermomicrobiales bacterium]
MRSLRVWLGFLISVIFLYLALRGQDFALIWDSMRSADYIWLIPATVVYFGGVALRAVRWDYLLRGVGRIRPAGLFPIVVIGYMANNVLPFRAGELVRAYALSSRYNVRKSASLATIGVERIFDGLTMLLFFALASFSITLTSDLRAVFNVASWVFALMAVGVILFVFAPGLRDRLIGMLLTRLPERLSERVGPMTQAFIDGLSIVRRRNDLLGVALASLCAWLLEASMYLMIAEAFGLDISPLGILMVTAVANLATLIPSSPGYVGAFEYGVILVVAGALGFGRELALSYAVVVHAALYLPVTLLGFVFWWRESLSWGAMRKAEKAAS